MDLPAGSAARGDRFVISDILVIEVEEDQQSDAPGNGNYRRHYSTAAGTHRIIPGLENIPFRRSIHRRYGRFNGNQVPITNYSLILDGLGNFLCQRFISE